MWINNDKGEQNLKEKRKLNNAKCHQEPKWNQGWKGDSGFGDLSSWSTNRENRVDTPAASRAPHSPGFPPLILTTPFQPLSLFPPHLPTSKCWKAFGLSPWTSFSYFLSMFLSLIILFSFLALNTPIHGCGYVSSSDPQHPIHNSTPRTDCELNMATGTPVGISN